MKLMKKAFCNLISVLLVLAIVSGCAVSVSAYKTDNLRVGYSSPLNISGDFLTSSAAHSENYLAAVDKVAEATSRFAQSVDISEFNITKADMDTTFSESLRYSYPELINLSSSIKYSYNPDNNIVITVYPQYLFDISLKEEYFNPFNAIVERVALEAGEFDSDFLKALYVHDFIATNAEYVMPTGDPSTMEYGFSHNAYGNLVNKNSVCEGYTLAYAAILKKLGIKNGYAVSDSMKHIWNTVTIEGKTYHVDVTFDDPTEDLIGRVCHENFLCTDEEIAEAGHSDWVTEDVITTVSYPDRYWDDINSKIIIVEDNLYYPAYNGGSQVYLEKRNITTNKAQKFNSMLNGKLWTDVENPNSFYLGNFSRMEYVRGRIYYSTPTGVNSILPDGSGDRVEYTLTNAESTRLYGFAYSDGIFYGEITPTPNPNGEIIKLDIELTEPVQIYGDINGDGQVNLEDAIMIQKYLIYVLELTDEQLLLGDVNNDGYVGTADSVIIQKYAASINVAYDVGSPLNRNNA